MHSRMATVVYATLNLNTWEVRIARAGHPYPLLVRADGSAEFLSELGVRRSGPSAAQTYDEQALTLSAGETLVLYTDGLIERRGSQLSEGEAALARGRSRRAGRARAQVPGDHDAPHRGPAIADDIAILAVQTVGLDELLEVEVPAAPAQLATARHLIRRWVEANDGTDDDCAAFAIAVSEACANSIEHAYGLRDETIELRASLVDGVATVTIRDRGKWREPRGGNRGRGIPIMREFMDEVSVEPTEKGTTVQPRPSPEGGTLRPELARLSAREPGRRRAGPSGGRGGRLERGRPERAAARRRAQPGARAGARPERDQLHRQLGDQPDLRRGREAAKPPSGASARGHPALVRRRGARRGFDGAVGRDRPALDDALRAVGAADGSD